MADYSDPRMDELLDLLENAWWQWSYPVPGNEGWAHDGGLSTLEDIAEVLWWHSRLESVTEHPEKDWYRRPAKPFATVGPAEFRAIVERCQTPAAEPAPGLVAALSTSRETGRLDGTIYAKCPLCGRSTLPAVLPCACGAPSPEGASACEPETGGARCGCICHGVSQKQSREGDSA